MITSDLWELEYRAGGWARARSGGVSVFLQLRPSAGGSRGRLQISAAVLTADEPVTAAMWQAVPMASIEQQLGILFLIRGPGVDETHEALIQPADAPRLSAEALERYFDQTSPLPYHQHWAPAAAGGVPGDLVKLEKPADGRLSDDFLQDVSRIYLAAVAARQSPAPVLAGASGASARTVQGWVAEARRRGHLPAGSRGRAG